MDTNEIMFYGAAALTFAAVVLLVFAINAMFFRRNVERRLTQVFETPKGITTEGTHSLLGQHWYEILESLSKLSLPNEGWQNSNVHLKFLRAGIHQPNAPKIHFGLKTLLAFTLPLSFGGMLAPYYSQIGANEFYFTLLFLAALGYYLPEIYLDRKTNHRKQDTQRGLPDLIDLLVICTESGLGLDAALNRVSTEIARTNPCLAEELYLTNLEIRAGAGRNNALKNLALRTNVDAVQNLTSMLIQADKFGTSISDSLKVQASLMRIQRIQVAEEAASKIPVKMLIPMVFCIFPALFIVIMGPAVIQISSVFK